MGVRKGTKRGVGSMTPYGEKKINIQTHTTNSQKKMGARRPTYKFTGRMDGKMDGIIVQRAPRCR